MKKLLPIITIMLLLTACKGKDTDSSALKVYTSFYAMQSFAEAVGGNEADVVSLAATGAEPHSFEPTAQDIAKLREADLFIYHGAGMDDWAADVIKTLPDTVTVVCASDGLETSGDVHLWLSFKNAYAELAAIYKGFAAADQDGSDIYFNNMTEYASRLSELEKEYAAAELDGKKLFVTHGAYGCLCADFGMRQLALEGVGGESDPSPAQTAAFVDSLKESGAKAVYYDPLEGGKTAEAAAREAGASALELYTFEGDTEGRDFLTVMRQNLEQLKKGL